MSKDHFWNVALGIYGFFENTRWLLRYNTRGKKQSTKVFICMIPILQKKNPHIFYMHGEKWKESAPDRSFLLKEGASTSILSSPRVQRAATGQRWFLSLTAFSSESKPLTICRVHTFLLRQTWKLLLGTWMWAKIARLTRFGAAVVSDCIYGSDLHLREQVLEIWGFRRWRWAVPPKALARGVLRVSLSIPWRLAC